MSKDTEAPKSSPNKKKSTARQVDMTKLRAKLRDKRKASDEQSSATPVTANGQDTPTPTVTESPAHVPTVVERVAAATLARAPETRLEPVLLYEVPARPVLTAKESEIEAIPEKKRPAAKSNLKQTKGGTTFVSLTRIKQWYIPVDAESYLALKDAGVPLTRIHQDFLPTVALITKKYGIRAREVKFKDEIMDPFLEKIGVSWNKKLYCRCSIGGRTMKFESTKPEAHKAATEAIPILQDLLEKFFSRWGFSSTFDYSEKNGRVKLNVEYWHDVSKLPVVILEEAAEDLKPIRLKLGRTRFTLSFDNYHGRSVTLPPAIGSQESRREHRIGYVHYMVEVAQGGKWTPVHSGKCTYTEMSSVLPLVNSLMNVPTMDPHNFDNLPD